MKKMQKVLDIHTNMWYNVVTVKEGDIMKYNKIFTAKATRNGQEREIVLADNTEESALLRMSKQNMYWSIDEDSVKSRKRTEDDLLKGM